MKIGFSFGRCVRDIVKGDVDYNDVYLIISRTAMYDSTHVANVIEEYLNRHDYLMGLDEGACYDIGERLYLEGRLYQPRIHGKHVRRVQEDAVWMDLAPTIMGEDQRAEQVKKAWDNYQLTLKMTSLKRFPPVEFNDDF